MAVEEGKVVLPLLFETSVAVMVREKQMDVKLRATGMIRGECILAHFLEYFLIFFYMLILIVWYFGSSIVLQAHLTPQIRCSRR